MRQEHPRPAKEHLLSARKLWFGSYSGILSTLSISMPGYPSGSLTPICRDAQGYPLLLLSHLAQHTQNLQADPHCSLIQLETGEGDVQQQGRLNCFARAEPLESPSNELETRYFRYFPDSRDYYETLNFRFYRLVPQRFYLIGGFGAARWIDPKALLPGLSFSAQEENDLLGRIVTNFIPSATPVGADCLGIDYRLDSGLKRMMLSEPTTSPAGLLEKLK